MKLLPAFIVIIGLSACQQTTEQEKQKKEVFTEDNLVKVNRYLVEKEQEQIEAYAKRRGWDMKTSETGLWYMIYEHGKGKNAEVGKKASMAYTIELLDGTLCYSADPSEPKTFRIGKGGVESGLEEGILLLQEGDKARFIMPPHLAHHLLGDENKIPPRASIVYDVELLKISD